MWLLGMLCVVCVVWVCQSLLAAMWLCGCFVVSSYGPLRCWRSVWLLRRSLLQRPLPGGGGGQTGGVLVRRLHVWSLWSRHPFLPLGPWCVGSRL